MALLLAAFVAGCSTAPPPLPPEKEKSGKY